MNQEAENKMADVLDRLSSQLEESQDTNRHSVFSLEKIVAAVITLVVTGVCIWVGTTLNSMSREVITLNATVGHQNDTIKTFVAVAAKNESRLYELEKEFARLGQVRSEIDAMRVMVTTVREEQLARTSNVSAVAELKELVQRIDQRISELESRLQQSEKRIIELGKLLNG